MYLISFPWFSLMIFIFMFADDIQLYSFCQPSETDALRSQMSRCLDAVSLWCGSYSLNLNVDKTKLMWCSSRRMKHSFLFDASAIFYDSVPLIPMTHVKCLGVITDNHLSFNSHVSKVVSSCFSAVRKIRPVRCSLSRSLLIILVNALVFPHLDYCIASFNGITKYSQASKCSACLFSIDILLRQILGWLPVEARINFRLAVLAHSCLHGLAPGSLSC